MERDLGGPAGHCRILNVSGAPGHQDRRRQPAAASAAHPFTAVGAEGADGAKVVAHSTGALPHVMCALREPAAAYVTKDGDRSYTFRNRGIPPSIVGSMLLTMPSGRSCWSRRTSARLPTRSRERWRFARWMHNGGGRQAQKRISRCCRNGCARCSSALGAGTGPHTESSARLPGGGSTCTAAPQST